jgi:hypothetical protein
VAEEDVMPKLKHIALSTQDEGQRKYNVEVKYTGPDGVTIDISETGWVGTS